MASVARKATVIALILSWNILAHVTCRKKAELSAQLPTFDPNSPIAEWQHRKTLIQEAP